MWGFAMLMFLRLFSPWFVSLYTLFPWFSFPSIRFCLSRAYSKE